MSSHWVDSRGWYMMSQVAASRIGSENTEAGDLLPYAIRVFFNENPNMFIELIGHDIWIIMHFLVQCVDACSCRPPKCGKWIQIA